MQVLCKFAGPLRTAAGVNQLELQVDVGSTTGAVLRAAADKLPGLFQELFGPDRKTYYSVFVNDVLVPEQERERAPVREGDRVLFLLPIAGGRSTLFT